MLAGDNGLLNKASQSRENTIIGQEKEAISLAWSSLITDNITKGTEITDSNLIDALEIFSKLKTYKPITNIMSSSDDLAPNIKIKYLQNPLVEVDSRLDALEQAFVAQGSNN